MSEIFIYLLWECINIRQVSIHKMVSIFIKNDEISIKKSRRTWTQSHNQILDLVHRCDSDHTAEMLYTHLQALIERPENQKKFADIERKLQMRGALPSSKKPPDSSLGSEVSRESDSGSNEERCVANLYDSLAAELKQKLSTGKKGLGQLFYLFLVGRTLPVHRFW